MSSAQTIRQPKGRPIGGQFAAQNRDEGDVVLPSEEASAPAQQGLTDREILEQSITLANQQSRRYGLSKEDAEDVAQETIYSVLMTRSRNGGAPIQGGLLRVVSRSMASRRVDTHKRHEDSKAFARWKMQTQQMEMELGRHLTRKELDAVAVDIREKWENPRHRPSVGFQHETKVVSSDVLGPNSGDNSALNRSAEQSVDIGSDEGHYLADQIADKSVSIPEARTRVWNAIAGDIGVAPAVPGATTPSDAKALRRVKNAVDVAEAYLQGHETPASEGLFLPFGPLTPRQKRDIAVAITDRPSVGHKLWRAARDFSAAE